MNIKKILLVLIKSGLTAIKLSFEDEGCHIDDIIKMKQLLKDRIPLYVKLGGPGARTEVKELLKYNINGFVAPLIESAYGLNVFIDTLKSCTKTSSEYNKLYKIINIESKTGIDSIDKILSENNAKKINQITIGRSDLIKSFNYNYDDFFIMSKCLFARLIATSYDLPVSIGGNITPFNVVELVQKIKPTFINTRNCIINIGKCFNVQKVVSVALTFEQKLLRLKHEEIKAENDKLKQRFSELKERKLK